MRATELTTAQIAALLDTAFAHERGGDGVGLTLDQRTALSDYLGCHPGARAEVWESWKAGLERRNVDLGDAEYWLNVEFIEPCPQEREA